MTIMAAVTTITTDHTITINQLLLKMHIEMVAEHLVLEKLAEILLTTMIDLLTPTSHQLMSLAVDPQAPLETLTLRLMEKEF